ARPEFLSRLLPERLGLLARIPATPLRLLLMPCRLLLFLPPLRLLLGLRRSLPRLPRPLLFPRRPLQLRSINLIDPAGNLLHRPMADPQNPRGVHQAQLDHLDGLERGLAAVIGLDSLLPILPDPSQENSDLRLRVRKSTRFLVLFPHLAIGDRIHE